MFLRPPALLPSTDASPICDFDSASPLNFDAVLPLPEGESVDFVDSVEASHCQTPFSASPPPDSEESESSCNTRACSRLIESAVSQHHQQQQQQQQLQQGQHQPQHHHHIDMNTPPITVEPQLSYWHHEPIQYKPSIWLLPIYGILQCFLIFLTLRWAWKSLPLWCSVPLFSAIGILNILYWRWQWSVVADLETDSQHATGKEFSLTNGHVHVHMQSHWQHAPSLLMSQRLSRADCLWYFWHVTVNFQLNTFCRIGRTIHGCISELLRFGTLRHGDHTQNYWFLMHSSHHRWMSDTDGNLHFPNVCMPMVASNSATTWGSWLSSRFRSTSVRTFGEVVMELDHSSHALLRIRLDEIVMEDAYECMVVICLMQGLYSHLQVHLAASEVSHCIRWPLHHQASIAVNGLNHAAVMAIGPAITQDHADWLKIPMNNALQGTPHPRGGMAHEILLKNSATYRMMLRAHKDSLIRRYAGPNPMHLAGLLHSGVLHGVDHLLPDLYAPFWLRSSILGSSFTGVILLGASVNVDFTSPFGKVQDELTQRFRLIVEEEAPQLLPGWQWAVAE